ncbi:MAG: FAD-dependent oxidoreductase [Candidatus Bathyarchaeota archaeon]|jgi:NADH oxidase (H2O2-forming)|nr:FAD-dependent oxidoreductase [Candidatus Bathyarchaeota archaeon]
MTRKIIIIGAHAAGLDAASAARKTDRTAEITLLTTEKKTAYSRCGIPFVLGGHIPTFDDLVVFPERFYKMMKLNLRTETTVTNIDPKAKTVAIQDKSGNKETLLYESLIVTTGATPFVPPIKGRNKKGVYVVRTIEDGEKINQALETAKSAVIVGAGLIGLEVAVACLERGLKTTVVEFLPYVLPVLLDKGMADRVQKMLEEKEMRIIVGKGAEEILGTDKVTGVLVAGEEIPADVVVVATGVRANVELAKNAGVALGEKKAIKTNLRMETNIKGIYAAGDCVETINLVTRRPTMSQLGTTAVKQAKVAGTNAAGGYATFTGALGSWITRLFETEIGGTGLTEFMAGRAGIETVTGTITSKTRADYFPGALPIRIKLIAEKESEKIIGAQIIGGEDIPQRINALSFTIQKEMTVRELAKAETCYAPPVCETWEPMVLAAEMVIRKLR